MTGLDCTGIVKLKGVGTVWDLLTPLHHFTKKKLNTFTFIHTAHLILCEVFSSLEKNELGV